VPTDHETPSSDLLQVSDECGDGRGVVRVLDVPTGDDGVTSARRRRSGVAREVVGEVLRLNPGVEDLLLLGGDGRRNGAHLCRCGAVVDRLDRPGGRRQLQVVSVPGSVEVEGLDRLAGRNGDHEAVVRRGEDGASRGTCLEEVSRVAVESEEAAVHLAVVAQQVQLRGERLVLDTEAVHLEAQVVESRGGRRRPDRVDRGAGLARDVQG
jgi:hypothetical protein